MTTIHSPARKNSVCCFSASDNSGHAGLQADLRTLNSLNLHGCSVVTAITVQNSQQFDRISAIESQLINEQWHSIRDDIKPKVCKIGMLSNAEQIQQLAKIASEYNGFWIADPVIKTSTEGGIHNAENISYYRQLLPQLDLITPNIPEAEALLGRRLKTAVDIQAAAQDLHSLGAKAVLIKGGHQDFDQQRCYDFFYTPEQQSWLSSPKQTVAHKRGTGCVMATAIAAFVSEDKALIDAVVLAHAYVQQGLRTGYQAGQAAGPIGHGGWPEQLRDYPTISETANHHNRKAFASCNTQALGLYPVIDSLDWLQKLLHEGVSTLQIRIKDQQGEDLKNSLKKAISLGKQHQARLFINDHWQLAIELGAYGVHLGQEDISLADLEAIKQAGLRLGISTHSEYEWARAHSLRPSYIALGAVFATQTKPAQVIGLDNLRRWVPLLQQQYPVTAIGGIHFHNIDQVIATSVGSIALVTAITLADNYRQATQQLLTIVENKTVAAEALCNAL